MASFTKWPISSPMTTAIYMKDSHEQTAISMMEARPLVFAYAPTMANWRNPYPKRRRRRTEKNGIGDLSKSLRNDFTNVEHDRELGLKCTYVDANRKTKQSGLCTAQLPQITARVTPVSNIANYLKNQYAQKVWAPKESEWGRYGLTPSCPVIRHLHHYAHKRLNTIT
jgi:hypothetical protein